MGRELKVRAYKKEQTYNNKPGLYKVVGIDWYSEDYCNNCSKPYTGEVMLEDEDKKQWSEYIEDVIIEQYTGLDDKSGQKIYEGDIVSDYYDNEEVGYIDFQEGSYCVEWSMNSENLDGELADCLVVIGNIHENPELLNA